MARASFCKCFIVLFVFILGLIGFMGLMGGANFGLKRSSARQYRSNGLYGSHGWDELQTEK